MEALFPEDPAAIGPYRLLGRLGEGGMGRVYLGRSPSGRMVAVKVVHGELAREPHFRRRFRAEIEAARRVSGMWTAPVLEADIESAVPWVATGYVAGPPLREVVDTLHGPLPEHSVWALAYGLASALMAVHRSGLIHRDLKPSNVMVTLEGPKVIDFGIARAVDASVVTRTGGMVGSPGYMPPEQITGEELTDAVDVFALGAVLAYAATGRSPFSWDGAQAHTVMYRVMNDPPNLGAENGRLKGDLRTLVLHCLAKDPRERPSLAGIPGLAEKRAGAEYWLPSGLTARLGQVAANLLAFDGPDADRPASSWGPRPPSAWDPRPAGGGPRPPTPAASLATVDPGEPEAPPPPAVVPPLPSLPPPQPQVWTPPTGADPSPSAFTRRFGRRSYALAAGVGGVVLALASWLAVTNLAGDDDGGNDQAAGSNPGEDTGGDAGEAPGPDARDGATGGDGGGESPLAELLPQDVRDAGRLTVHFGESHEGLISDDNDEGEMEGFELDLVQALGEKLGVDIALVPTDDREDAAAAAVDEGQESASHIAVGNFVANDDTRERLGVDFVEHFQDSWAVMSENPEQSGDLDDLCGQRITLYEDSEEEESVREATADCPGRDQIVPVGSKSEMAERIREGRSDVAVMVYTMAAHFVGADPAGEGLYVSTSDEPMGHRGIAIPAGQDELARAVSEALGELHDDGTYQQLLEKWHIEEAALD